MRQIFSENSVFIKEIAKIVIFGAKRGSIYLCHLEEILRLLLLENISIFSWCSHLKLHIIKSTK